MPPTWAGIVESRPLVGTWRTRALEVSGSGPVLLLLHGFGDHAGTWLPVLERLAKAGAHAVAVDLPGYGEADPGGPGQHLEQLDGFLRAALDQWTVDGTAPIVVGNSLGGVLALRAGQEPNAPVSGIVPVSPAGFGHAWYVDLLEKYSWLNPLMFVPVVPMPTFRKLTALGYTWAAAGGSAKVLPGIAAAAAAHFRTRADVKRVLGNAPELLADIRNSPMTDVAVPCLVIWGRHDRLTLVRGAKLLARLAPGAEIAVIDDCGHCAQVTRPDLVAEYLLRFAKRLDEHAQSL